MFAGVDLSHPMVIAAFTMLTFGCAVFVYKLYRRKRPGKHTPWSRLYDKELH